MIGTGLFLKEWKQNKAVIFLLWLVLVVEVPFRIWSAYSSHLQLLKLNQPVDPVFAFNFSHNSFIGISMYALIIFPILQLGIERSRGTFDFSLSLPYSRRRLFMTKWLNGVLSIIIPVLISYLLSAAIFQFTHAKVTGFHDYYLLYPSCLLMFYTLIFAAGCLTGTSFAQGLVAFSVMVLPVLFFTLLMANVNVFTHGASYIELDNQYKWVLKYSPSNSLIFNGEGFASPVVPLVYTVIFSLIAYFSFVKQPIERNGYFFLWKGINHPVQIIVILLGVMGFGSAGYSFSSGQYYGYFIGVLIGAAIGLAIGYFLIYQKFKIN
ncbi:ABC transporter permease subunit [Metabacillus sp. RGM 3146]|uniref:ABC transporter permease subunit n=1 Tax=Metabacillus sp. RGM 3146 TaxID=3401092 RepID=UPI003B9D88D8